MMKKEKIMLKKRSEIPVELTWNTKDLYATEEAYEKDMEALRSLTEGFVTSYEGNLTTAGTMVSAVLDYAVILEKAGLLMNYASLEYSVDMTDSRLLERITKAEAKVGECFGKLSFFRNELLRAEEGVMKEAMENREVRGFLSDVLRDKHHTLSPEAEAVLAAFRPVLSSNYLIYNQLKQADMKFDSFEVDGTVYPMSFVLFENKYQYAKDTRVRRAAFESFSKTLAAYRNGFAVNYAAHVQKEKTEATLRGFDSVFDYLLDSQKVERELYDRQIDVIMEKLSPVMRKYARLLQKVHGLEKMTFADLKTPIDSDFAPTVTIDEAWDYAEKALAVLGEEYLEIIRSARKERWADFAENIGKSTGGFCASPYGAHPYILLSWTGLLSEVFTLVHELGHGAQFTLTHRAHNILDSEPSLYLIEAPSTCNEVLLTNYLMTESSEKRFRRWVLSSMIENTYYHNFVTHLLEAHYQREVYRLVDAGEALTADRLSALKKATLEEFWGDTVEINEGAELTWMRQPHYFMGLYSYTYSAGLTISTVAGSNIMKKGAPAVEDWLNFLRAGGSLRPVEMADLAKVNIRTDEALKETIAYISSLVDEVQKLTEEME